MLILKGGDLDKINQTITFECDNCGCVFKADKNEYEHVSNQREWLETGASYKCACPFCKKKVYERGR